MTDTARWQYISRHSASTAQAAELTAKRLADQLASWLSPILPTLEQQLVPPLLTTFLATLVASCTGASAPPLDCSLKVAPICSGLSRQRLAPKV